LNELNISKKVVDLAIEVEMGLKDQFAKLDEVREFNQYKVLAAMQKHRLSDSHFGGTTGYGYGDPGREVLDKVYADIFGAEDALVRPQIVSGTHALTLCLFGVLRPGDEMLAVTESLMTHWIISSGWARSICRKSQRFRGGI
jgi:cystathionine beta-lyase family protein involved in aluminum resistance